MSASRLLLTERQAYGNYLVFIYLLSLLVVVVVVIVVIAAVLEAE